MRRRQRQCDLLDDIRQGRLQQRGHLGPSRCKKFRTLSATTGGHDYDRQLRQCTSGHAACTAASGRGRYCIRKSSHGSKLLLGDAGKSFKAAYDVLSRDRVGRVPSDQLETAIVDWLDFFRANKAELVGCLPDLLAFSSTLYLGCCQLLEATTLTNSLANWSAAKIPASTTESSLTAWQKAPKKRELLVQFMMASIGQHGCILQGSRRRRHPHLRRLANWRCNGSAPRTPMPIPCVFCLSARPKGVSAKCAGLLGRLPKQTLQTEKGTRTLNPKP